MDKEPTHIKIIIALIALVGALGAAAIPTFLGKPESSPAPKAATAADLQKPAVDVPATAVVSAATAAIAPAPTVDRPPPSQPDRAPPVHRVSTRSEPQVIDIAGTWIGVGSPGESLVIQSGRSYTTSASGVSPAGVPFQSWGQGQINGNKLSGTYQATSVLGSSIGSCEGTIMEDGQRIVSICRDSAIGLVRLEQVRK